MAKKKLNKISKKKIMKKLWEDADRND